MSYESIWRESAGKTHEKKKTYTRRYHQEAEGGLELGVRPATYQRWKSEYGGMRTNALKRLKELEKENGRLKRVVADLTLEKAILKEIAEGKW